MIKKKTILKWIILVISFIAFQTLTYLTIGQNQLKDKLLSNDFANLNYHSDSVFIRNFYVSDCFVGENIVFLTHNLEKYEQEVKEKLHVKYIYFDNKQNFSWTDSIQNKFNLIYYTWATRPHWLTLFRLYSTTQTERIIIDRKYDYERIVTYHWFLFFWIPTFERFNSADYK